MSGFPASTANRNLQSDGTSAGLVRRRTGLHHIGKAALALACVLSLVPTPTSAATVVVAPHDVVLLDTVPEHPSGEKLHPLPPQTPADILNQKPNYAYTRYNLQREAYIEWVRREMRPRSHQYEEFALQRDWEPFLRDSALPPPDNEVVAVISCSADRLPFVRRMHSMWQGPMALALFVPFPTHMPQAGECRSRMLDYVLNMTRTDAAAPLALSFIYANEEQYTSSKCDVHEGRTGLEPAFVDEAALVKRYRGITHNYLAIYDDMFPVNQARNLGVGMVQRNAFVMLIDADFVPSSTPGVMYQRFKSDPLLARMRHGWQAARRREVLILPAFGRLRRNLHETPADSACDPPTAECWLYQKVDVPYTKDKLRELVRAGELESFYYSTYPKAYGCYDGQDRWLKGDEEYEAWMTPECEPFLLGLKDAMPTYDNRFRGYQADKVSFIAHLEQLGTTFTVHPTAFITHLPHARSFSVDDVRMQLPARYDKWTAPRVLLAISIGEFAGDVELAVLRRDGVEAGEALARAEKVRKDRERKVLDYWLAQIPTKKHGPSRKSGGGS